MHIFVVMSLLLLIHLTIIIIIIKIIKSYISSRERNKKLPPGPKPLPIIGNLLDLDDKPHKSLAKLSQKYGPIMRLKLGQVTTIVVSSSATAKEIFQTHDQIFSNRVAPHAVQAYNHGETAMSWIPSASTLWKNLRKISKSHFFSGKVLDANMSVRHAKVQNLLHELKKREETGEAVDIRKVAKTSLNFLTTSFLSVDTAIISDSNENKDDGFAREIKETVWGLIDESGKTNVTEFFPFLKRLDPQGIGRRGASLMKRFMDVLDLLMDQKSRLKTANKLNCGEDRDALDVLIDMMAIHKENINRQDHPLDRKSIQHLLLALFLAGTETTSSTLEWSMAELLRNPSSLWKAREEVNRVIGKGNQVKESDTARLPYLQSVVKETLRLHPPLPVVPREAGSDVEVNGFTVPKGSKVLVNVWAIARDPSVWENPDKFDPERFMGSKNIDVRARNYEFAPFGGGRRICPGLPLAMRVLHLMLGSLILSYDWKLENGVSPHTLDMDEEFGLTLHRANPLQAIPLLC